MSSRMASVCSGSAGGAHLRGDRPYQHSCAPLHSSKTSPAAAARSAAKSTSTPSCATGSSTCWTTGGQNGDGACSGACGMFERDQPEHSPALETELATSSIARQEDFTVTRRHDTAERAHHASDRHHPVTKRGDVACALSYKKPAQCVKELHNPEQQHANTHRLFIKLC